MSGLKIVIPALCTDTTLPKRRTDPVLTDGSLLLITPSHDTTPWISGVPAQGYEAPNLAEQEVRQLIPSGSINPVFEYSGDLSGAMGTFERTAKGGLHCITTQSGSMLADNGLSIALPFPLMQYILENNDHEFYFSHWRRITREALTTSPDGAKTLTHVGRSTVDGRLFFITHTDGQQSPIAATRTGYRTTGLNAVGNGYTSISGPCGDTTATDASTDYAASGTRAIAQFGSVGPQNNYAPVVPALQSWVLYRIYMEDLTVSGRTFAEVDAIDFALYQEQLETVGGKYYGDSFTSPAAY